MATTTIVTNSAAAPGAGTVLTDTGALPGGRYEVIITITADDTAAAGKFIELQHRNAANNANVDTWGNFPVPQGGAPQPRFEIVLADGERLRLVTGGAAAASTKYTGAIWARLMGAS